MATALRQNMLSLVDDTILLQDRPDSALVSDQFGRFARLYSDDVGGLEKIGRIP